MNNQIVVTSGDMGSGSSAMTDLLTEIEGYKNTTNSFEYIFMHCPGGLFDLEDKLLLGNNALRSDEAVHVFLETMQDLYCKSNYWPSGYKYLLSSDFLKYCRELISNIACVSIDETFWYYQENPQNFKMHVMSILYGKKIMRALGVKKPLRYNEMTFAYPTAEEFYRAAKNFLGKIFAAMGSGNENIIIDQLLLPHNIYRIDRYFGDELRVFVVERDPRDVFLLNKYYWSQKNAQVPYPYDVNDFCKMYRAIRDNEILYITECQNTSKELLKLCLSRASSECKIVIEGDYHTQVDSYLFDGSSNGMKRVIDVLKGEQEFGYVNLPNVWRSKIATLVDKL